MITYNWKITTCEHDTATGGIITAHWRADASQTVDGRLYTSSAYATLPMTPDPDDVNFIPYENVTEQQVLNWVWAQVDKTAIEQKLAVDLDKKINPPVAKGLPWEVPQPIVRGAR